MGKVVRKKGQKSFPPPPLPGGGRERGEKKSWKILPFPHTPIAARVLGTAVEFLLATICTSVPLYMHLKEPGFPIGGWRAVCGVCLLQFCTE